MVENHGIANEHSFNFIFRRRGDRTRPHLETAVNFAPEVTPQKLRPPLLVANYQRLRLIKFLSELVRIHELEGGPPLS